MAGIPDDVIQEIRSRSDIVDVVSSYVALVDSSIEMENFVNDNYVTVGSGNADTLTFGDSNEFKLPEEKLDCEELKNYIGKEVIAGIRSEAIHDEPMYLSQFSDWVIDATVEVTELMGAEIFLYINSQGQNLIARVSPRSKAKAGDVVKVAFDVNRLHIFDKDTELCICH